MNFHGPCKEKLADFGLDAAGEMQHPDQSDCWSDCYWKRRLQAYECWKRMWYIHILKFYLWEYLKEFRILNTGLSLSVSGEKKNIYWICSCLQSGEALKDVFLLRFIFLRMQQTISNKVIPIDTDDWPKSLLHKHRRVLIALNRLASLVMLRISRRVTATDFPADGNKANINPGCLRFIKKKKKKRRTKQVTLWLQFIALLAEKWKMEEINWRPKFDVVSSVITIN